MSDAFSLAMAANVLEEPGAIQGLVAGIVVATLVSGTVGGWGIVLAVKSDAIKFPMLLQVPFLLAGIVASIVGLVLLSTEQSPPPALGLLGGGAFAAIDSAMFLMIIPSVHRRIREADRGKGE